MMSAGMDGYDQDYDLMNEFESYLDVPERSFATLTPIRAVAESPSHRPAESLGAMVSGSRGALVSSRDLQALSSQHSEETIEAGIQKQLEMGREVQRSFSLQGQFVAFWNMLRGGVSIDDTSIAKDYRQDVRPSQRSSKER